MIGNNETNFPHELLFTDRKVSSLRKSFVYHSSADINLSKARLSGLKTGLPMIKDVIKSLAKIVLIPASAADVEIYKKY